MGSSSLKLYNVSVFCVVIDDENLRDVLTELIEVAHKWRPIGQALGCPHFIMTQIEQKPANHSSDDFLNDMLVYRMKQLKPSRLTWKEIIKVLRKRTVSEDVLANSIAQQHCPSEYLEQPPCGQ